jgi:hypothetical protein
MRLSRKIQCVLLVLATVPAAAAEKKNGNGRSNTGTPPANTWTARTMTGWKGKTWYGRVIPFGLASAKGRGLLTLSLKEKGKAVVRSFDAATGAWKQVASAPLDKPYKDRKYKKYPVAENLHGMQLCHDPDRDVLVGITSTDLDGRGRTVEFDLKAKRFAAFNPEPSPPVVTAASLCYDPVNKEVVLATGGFSPVGGTDSTWLYDGTKRKWRQLEGPAEVEEVRVPLEQAGRDLRTLRWLVWKNLEFRATDRVKRLDERALAKALAEKAAKLAGEMKKLGGRASANAGKARRPYHRKCLASAGGLLSAAATDLGGLDAAIKSASPGVMERLYRGKILPALDKVEHALSELAVTPEPRMSARLVYDPKTKTMICFGGDGQDHGWTDTWIYHGEGRWWERKHWQVNGLGGASRAMAFDPGSGVAIRFQAQTKWGHFKGWRMWAFDPAGGQWLDLAMQAPREICWLEHDPVSGCLVGMNSDMKSRAQLLKLNLASLKRTPAGTGPRPVLPAPKGKYVLRDATTVAELRKWKGEQDGWVKAVPANTWVPVPTRGTGRPNWGRSWSSIVYDPDRLQMYYKGGGHGSYHGAVTDHYDIPTGRWFRSDRRYGPPWPMGTYFAWGRSFSYAPWAVHTYKYGLYYNPPRKRLQRSIGQSGRMKGIGSGNVEYDPDTGCWGRRLMPVGIGGTGGAFGGGVNVPGVPDGMISINNFTRYGVRNGTGAYLTAEGVKRFSNLGRLPRAWEDHCFSWFFDPKRKRVMYYGGGGAGKKNPDLNRKNHKLFALDVTATAPKWVDLKVRPANGSGLPLSSREVVYVPKHDRFLMVEGRAPGRQGAGLGVYALDPEANTLRKLKLARGDGVKIRNAGVSQGLQYDPVTDLCYYIGIAKGYRIMWYAFRYVPE